MRFSRRTFLGSPLARLLRPLAVLALRAAGWRAVGTLPPDRKAMVIAGPHTSNWDGVLLILLAMELRLDLYWLGKKQLFPPLLAPLVRWFGGISVDRDSPRGLANQVAAAFRASKDLLVLIPPEGTRSRAPYWKSGFYRIAQTARLPVILAFVDFATRTGGIGPRLELRGLDCDLDSPEVRQDLEEIEAFYATKKGRHPERFGPVRFRRRG